MDDKIWTKLKISLKKSVGENSFNNWLSPINFSHVEEDMAVLTVPTNFLGNYVSQNFGELITAQISSNNNKISRIRFEVDTSSNSLGVSQPSAVAHTNISKDNELTGAQLDKRFTFDAFVVGNPTNWLMRRLGELLREGLLVLTPFFYMGELVLAKPTLCTP